MILNNVLSNLKRASYRSIIRKQILQKKIIQNYLNYDFFYFY